MDAPVPEKTVTCAVECFTCHKKRYVETPREPATPAEMHDVSQAVGYIHRIDFKWKRLLFFCGEKCERAARTKAGNEYRKNPPGRPGF